MSNMGKAAMVDNSEDPPPKKPRRRRRTAEEIWVKEFLGFSGTDNVTRFCKGDLSGVSLTRAVQALCRGDCIQAEKCDGPGTVCTFVDQDDDDLVEVVVFFIASESILEIRAARRVNQEEKNEPDAA
jgi:hypothetical protein